MKIHNPEIFDLHAEFCKVMASSKRLMIIDMLSKRDMSVGEMAETLGVPPATVSQHLRLLRDRQLVTSRKDGHNVFYHLINRRIVEACHILRQVFLENLKQRGAVAEDVAPENLIEDIQTTGTPGQDST